MSINFTVRGQLIDIEEGTGYINLANANAFDLAAWIGLPFDHCGEIKTTELAALCRRRLWPERREQGAVARETTEEIGARGCRVVHCGRRAEYLPERTEELLKLAESAGPDGWIDWG